MPLNPNTTFTGLLTTAPSAGSMKYTFGAVLESALVQTVPAVNTTDSTNSIRFFMVSPRSGS
jgi:hypothetical protein